MQGSAAPPNPGAGGTQFPHCADQDGHWTPGDTGFGSWPGIRSKPSRGSVSRPLVPLISLALRSQLPFPATRALMSSSLTYTRRTCSKFFLLQSRAPLPPPPGGGFTWRAGRGLPGCSCRPTASFLRPGARLALGPFSGPAVQRQSRASSPAARPFPGLPARPAPHAPPAPGTGPGCRAARPAGRARTAGSLGAKAPPPGHPGSSVPGAPLAGAGRREEGRRPQALPLEPGCPARGRPRGPAPEARAQPPPAAYPLGRRGPGARGPEAAAGPAASSLAPARAPPRARVTGGRGGAGQRAGAARRRVPPAWP